MSELNRAETVQAQYATSTNLNTRISIHDQYSTNPLGFGNWIASQYQIEKGMNVLELGCGTGAIWQGRDDLIANCASLVLSDVSPGMLETARKALKGYDTIAYKIVDIQDIPFADNSFDIVIANMMLYHVPDLKKGLAESRGDFLLRHLWRKRHYALSMRFAAPLGREVYAKSQLHAPKWSRDPARSLCGSAAIAL